MAYVSLCIGFNQLHDDIAINEHAAAAAAAAASAASTSIVKDQKPNLAADAGSGSSRNLSSSCGVLLLVLAFIYSVAGLL